tara:strand:+ start:638 stop:1141 length:504 start_codon:yes stop_codon:yes gene_type:complete
MGSTPVKQNRTQPTYEGTDEYRKEKDIPKKEFQEKGVKNKDVKLKDLRSGDKYIDLDKGGDEPIKRSGFGPRTDGFTDMNSTKKPTKTNTKKKHKDGPKTNAIHNGKVIKGNWVNPHAVKSDAQKKSDAAREAFNKMTPTEKKAVQAAADDKADKFHKRGKYKVINK